MGASNVERPPGEIVSIEKGGLQIAAKGSTLSIGKLRLEKGEKMGPVEFARRLASNRETGSENEKGLGHGFVNHRIMEGEDPWTERK